MSAVPTGRHSAAKQLLELAQRLYDEQGVQINSCSFEWIDASSVAQQRVVVETVRTDATVHVDAYFASDKAGA